MTGFITGMVLTALVILFAILLRKVDKQTGILAELKELILQGR